VDRPFAEFRGWVDPLIVFSRFPPRPWVGLVLPEGESKAVIRRAFLEETTLEELIQLLSLAEQKYGRPSTGISLNICELAAREFGLLNG